MTRFTPAIGARILFGFSLMITVPAFVMKTQFGRPFHDRIGLHMSTDASSLPSLEQVRNILALFRARIFESFSEITNLTWCRSFL